MKKEKVKEFAKKYLIGFILGIISACSISVIAATYFPSNDVTYDNTASGLKSTNVQGAIDELYGVCFPKTGGDIITDLLPDNPDELYKDEHGNIRYYGKTPNNYVSFNNELWRILGVIDGKIKIIRNESIGERAWTSSRYNNNWTSSELKSYLNNEYYNNINGKYKEMISEETYFLGGPKNESDYKTLTASDYYNVERSNSVNSRNPVSTKQYIGLIYPSDYGYAAGSNCLSTALFDFSGNCKNSDYLSDENGYWLQTPTADGFNALIVGSYGFVYEVYCYSDTVHVRPALYLISEVKITGGDGSQNNPFQLSM